MNFEDQQRLIKRVADRAFTDGVAYATGVPPKSAASLKTFRIPEDLYQAAKAKAKRKGSNLSVEIRKFLERYVKRV